MHAFFAGLGFWPGPRETQKRFATAQEADKALVGAYKKADIKALVEILGPKRHRLVSSGDLVEARIERDWFVSLHKEGHEILPESSRRAVVHLVKDEQPYPIPIVNKGGKGRFDPSEGHEELLSRRMSKNELSALSVVVACVEAQKEYRRKDHDGDQVLEYAQRWLSTEGNRDLCATSTSTISLTASSQRNRRNARRRGKNFRSRRAAASERQNWRLPIVVPGLLGGFLTLFS